MTRNEPAPTWREMAVARSLDSARSRAEHRVQRFLDAALDLMNEGQGKDFTVQEVVERSGQSLRSFYQFFDGKHELLLALFEDSVRATAEQLTERLAEQDDPLERLHSFVVEYYRFCRPGQRGKAAKAKLPPPVVVAFAQQLLTEYPQAAARAFTPIVSLFRDVLAEAVKAGAVRKDLRQEQVAGVVLQEVMFNAFSSTISGSSPRAEGDAAEELWDLIFYGIGAPA